MKTIVLMMALALAGTAAGEDPEPAGSAVPLVSFAERIDMGLGTADVRSLTADLGKPAISFAWCNRAGCVDRTSEVGATKMTTLWSGAADFLSVSFCRHKGEWAVGAVLVMRRAPKDEWGSSPKPVAIFSKRTPDFFSACYSG